MLESAAGAISVITALLIIFLGLVLVKKGDFTGFALPCIKICKHVNPLLVFLYHNDVRMVKIKS
jgi:hypothetical protein